MDRFEGLFILCLENNFCETISEATGREFEDTEEKLR